MCAFFGPPTNVLSRSDNPPPHTECRAPPPPPFPRRSAPAVAAAAEPVVFFPAAAALEAFGSPCVADTFDRFSTDWDLAANFPPAAAAGALADCGAAFFSDNADAADFFAVGALARDPKIESPPQRTDIRDEPEPEELACAAVAAAAGDGGGGEFIVSADAEAADGTPAAVTKSLTALKL